MVFERIKTPGIAHIAYLIGDQGAGAVIDPRRDVGEYLRLARERGLAIKYIVLTHRQEDFVMGATGLQDFTGARIVAGEHPHFGRCDVRLREGEELRIGSLRMKALHTPGHTPESMCYAVYLDAAPDRAWGVFTGDTLFIGDSGRTDLPDPNRTGENAELLQEMVHGKLIPLGGQALIFPAHGSGSVCGSEIADRDHSTLGIERASNPVFLLGKSDFRKRKLEERIPRPPHFNRIEELNLEGGVPLAGDPAAVPVLQPQELKQWLGSGLIIDTRLPETFATGHIPGSLNLWLDGLPVFAGWIARHDTPIFLVVDDPSRIQDAVLHLARIGLDGVQACLAGGFEAWRDEGLPVETNGTLTPEELQREPIAVLDVREITEYESGHISEASWRYVGEIAKRGIAHSKHEAIAVTCSVGHRAGLAVSLLRRQGFEKVYNLLGGMTAWSKLGFPSESGKLKARKAA